MKRAETVCFALCMLSLPAMAAPHQHAPSPAREVAALLELQRSGRAASPHRQTLPGDAQSRAWQRYLNSFSHPVPARYIDESFKSR